MNKPSYLEAEIYLTSFSRDETGEVRDFAMRVTQAAPVFDEWITTLNADERCNAKSDVLLALCVTSDCVRDGQREARERRRRNRPHAMKALTQIAKAKHSLGMVENSNKTKLINCLDEIESDIKSVFIEKSDRVQKSNWQDWARFFHRQLCELKHRKTPYSKPLELRESDWVLIIHAAIGDYVSRDAVKNWLNREGVPLKY